MELTPRLLNGDFWTPNPLGWCTVGDVKSGESQGYMRSQGSGALLGLPSQQGPQLETVQDIQSDTSHESPGFLGLLQAGPGWADSPEAHPVCGKL